MCSKELRRSLQILENICSKDSIELAHEYQKVAEVLYNANDLKEARMFAGKARSIFSQKYANSHPLIDELDLLSHQIDCAL